MHALANLRRAAIAPSEAARASQHEGESRVDDSNAAHAPRTSSSRAPLSTKASALRQRAPSVADGVAFFAAASARFRTDQSGGDRRYEAARTRRPRTSAWHVIRTPSFGKETAMTTVFCWTTAGAETVRARVDAIVVVEWWGMAVGLRLGEGGDWDGIADDARTAKIYT